jgi:YVTN family beta-propeller protein
VAQTLNMNRGINFEAGDPADERKRLFLAVPWAIAFKNHADEGYAVSLSSNVVVKVTLDADGTPTVNAPKAAGDPGSIVRILVGQGPRGIVVNGDDTRAYVANENSRDVSVIDLRTDSVVATVSTSALPQPGTEAARRLVGKAVFDSSTGVDLPALSSPALSGVVQRFPARLSSEGWGSCFACHGFGRTDNVVWMFGSGPRRTSSLHASFNPEDAGDIKLLNHSAINNEVQDFQNNILDVSGGLGLIVDAAGNTAGGPDGSGAGGRSSPSGRTISKKWRAGL